MIIPFLPLKILNQPLEKELVTAFKKFLADGQYILGKNVSEFENNFANYCQSKHCVGLANGLDALILILESFEFAKNSEVIVPANTYYASILAILKAGLKPVLVEPDINTYLLDTKKIADAITTKTVGILAVNLYGKMCDFRSLSAISKKYNLKLIVDAAQSHGAIYENSKNCYAADATAYSFYPSKNLGALSDAGAIVTDHLALASKVKSLRNYGSNIKYNFEYQGINSRLSELQAGFLNVKLKYLDQEIKIRRTLAETYINTITNPQIVLPPSDTVNKDAWHLFVIRTTERQKFTNLLSENGIGFDIHYPIAPHKQKALVEFSDLKLPVTEKIHNEVVSLPLNSTLTEVQQEKIIQVINTFKHV